MIQHVIQFIERRLLLLLLLQLLFIIFITIYVVVSLRKFSFTSYLTLYFLVKKKKKKKWVRINELITCFQLSFFSSIYIFFSYTFFIFISNIFFSILSYIIKLNLKRSEKKKKFSIFILRKIINFFFICLFRIQLSST